MENRFENAPACSNRHPCPCTVTSCDKHGKCCDCVAYHRKEGSLTSCMKLVAQGK